MTPLLVLFAMGTALVAAGLADRGNTLAAALVVSVGFAVMFAAGFGEWRRR